MPAGRPTKLTPELIIKASGYLTPQKTEDGELEPIWKTQGDVVPTIEGLCLYIAISRETAYQWEKENVEFSDITTAVRQQQSKLLINGALGNKFNATIAKLLLSSKHGYVEKSSTDITTGGQTLNEPDPAKAAAYADYLKNK